MRFSLVALKHAVQEPDDKTVREQNERAHETRAMPQMPNFDWNQRCGRENHEELRPALLHVNADSFGEKNCRIKKRQKTCGPQGAAGEHGLQFVEQIGNRLAMFQQNFVSGPIRQGIDPAGPRVEKKQRNTNNQEQRALGDFEERDQLEIANPTRALQDCRLMCRVVHSQVGHCPTVAAGVSPAKLTWSQPTRLPLQLTGNDRTLPTANFQLVPIGIFEKAGVIAAAICATDLWAFQILPADLAHKPGESINFFTSLSPKSDSRAIGLMTSILREAEERFRFVSAGHIEDSPPPARAIAGKTKRG